MPTLPKELESFLRTTGKVGARTLSFLGQHQALVSALDTELGAIILKHAVSRHEQLARKVLDNTATEEEIIERKALFKILVDWSELIVKYNKALEFVHSHEKS